MTLDSRAGCLASIDVAKSSARRGTLAGARRSFRNREPRDLRHRPIPRLAWWILFYQPSVTVGTGCDRTRLRAPSLPLANSVRATRCYFW